MTNRVKLDQICGMTIAEVSALPIEQLAMLQDDYAELKADTKTKGDRITDALSLRYSEKAASRRKAVNKDSGSVTIEDGGFRCVADLPKKVSWDQPTLARAIEKLREWKENPADYVTIEVKVSETKYNAWPPAVRELFTPARTVSNGSATFKLEPSKGGMG